MLGNKEAVTIGCIEIIHDRYKRERESEPRERESNQERDTVRGREMIEREIPREGES